VVFIAGCEVDFMPYKRSEEDTVDMAEERRLFYVAMTRAKERLYLTHAKKRRIFGKYVSRNPSPFVGDIESRLKSDDTPLLKKKKKDKPKQEQLKLF
jgi:DNA helicase-2/ATP-dependent DNA helicase PcrA